MTALTTYRIDPKYIPLLLPGVTPVIFEFTTASSGDASSGDSLTLTEIPDGYCVLDSQLSISATLGSGCTMQLRQGTTALTAASTAAAANFLRQTAFAPASSDGTHTLNILIGGGNIAAAAAIKVLAFLYQFRH